MRGERALIGALTALLLVGCASPGSGRLRWAQGSTPLLETVTPTLSVTSISAVAGEAAKASDFSDRAEAAYITALSGKLSDPTAFRSAVAGSIAPAKIADVDQARLKRTIVIAIGKHGYQAGHRLVIANVKIVPVGFVFADFKLAVSKYETVDLENVSVSATTTAKVDASPPFSGVGIGDASLAREKQAGFTYSTQARIEAFTPDVRPDRIEIFQQSNPNEDLTGTVLLNASVRPVPLDANGQRRLLATLGLPYEEPFRYRVDQADPQTVVEKLTLTDPKGRLVSPAKASVSTAVHQIWRARPLYVCAALSYVERVPQSDSARFFDEGRQVVVEREGVLPGRLYLLVPPEDVSQPLWSITDPAGGGLMIDDGGKPAPFTFSDFLDASRFAAWVNAKRATRVGTRRLWSDATGRPQPLVLSAGHEVTVIRTYGPGPETAPDGALPCRVPER